MSQTQDLTTRIYRYYYAMVMTPSWLTSDRLLSSLIEPHDAFIELPIPMEAVSENTPVTVLSRDFRLKAVKAFNAQATKELYTQIPA